MNAAWVAASRYAMQHNGMYPSPDTLAGMAGKMIPIHIAGSAIVPWTISYWRCPNTRSLIQLKAYNGDGTVIDSLDNFPKTN